MDLQTIIVFLSAVVSLISIITTGATVGYVFAVLRTEVSQLKIDGVRYQAHTENARIHHNGEAFREFEKRIEGELRGLSDQVKEVKTYVEEIDGKIDRLKSGRTRSE